MQVKIEAAARLRASTDTHIKVKGKDGKTYTQLNRNQREINFVVLGTYPEIAATAFSPYNPGGRGIVTAGKTTPEVEKVAKHHVKQFGVTDLELIQVPQ